MAVSDDEVAVLRAILAGESDEYARRYSGLDNEATARSYKALIVAAFFEIVDRRFAPGASSREVNEFVEGARAISDRTAADLDPDIAERAIRAVYTDETTDDIDDQKLLTTKLMLLAAIGSVVRYDDMQLDDFVLKARAMADYLLR